MNKNSYEYIYDRVDFVPHMKCSFCNNMLTKGQAVYLVNTRTGEEEPAGPVCAIKNAGKLSYKIPNFTRTSFFVGEEKNTLEGSKILGKRKTISDPHVKNGQQKLLGYKELEYLRLRIEKLKSFPDAYYPPLITIWERFKQSTESPNDIKYIERLIAKSYHNMPLLSPENLQACYAYSFWLALFNKEKEDNAFIRAMLSSLQINNYLTINQIEGINRWFGRCEGYPQLDTQAFKETIKCDAKIRPWIYKKKGKN